MVAVVRLYADAVLPALVPSPAEPRASLAARSWLLEPSLQVRQALWEPWQQALLPAALAQARAFATALP